MVRPTGHRRMAHQPAGQHEAEGSPCWSSDMGPCHNDGGPAIFWPCSPVSRIGAGEFAPGGRTSTGQEPHVAFAAVPAAVLDEEAKREIGYLARKTDTLLLQVESCLNGISDLQVLVSTLTDKGCLKGADRSPMSSPRSSQHSSADNPALAQLLSVSSTAANLGTAEAQRQGMLNDIKSKEESPNVKTFSVESPLSIFASEDARASRPSSQRTGSIKELCSSARRSFRDTMTQQLRLITRQRRRGVYAQAIWRFLEEPESSRAASWFNKLWTPFIMATVVATLCQEVRPPPFTGITGLVVELCFDVIFASEVLLRLGCSPNPCAFMKSAANVIDLLASLPLAGRLAVLITPGAEQGTFALALLCLSPVIRLLKTLRHFQQFHLFIAVISFTKEALTFLLLTLVLIVLTFSSMIYLVESREHIETLPMAMWLIVVTMTTVGYGDVTPDSNLGHAITAVLLVGSVLFMAMPIGIIGNAFTEVWKDRDRILLNHRFQDRMVQCGYTAEDIGFLFTQFDLNSDGDLNLAEFVAMVKEMQLGIQEERAVQLFEGIDKDGSGGIDPREFVRCFFPSRFNEIYGSATVEEKSPRGPSKRLRRRNSLNSRTPQHAENHEEARSKEVRLPQELPRDLNGKEEKLRSEEASAVSKWGARRRSAEADTGSVPTDLTVLPHCDQGQ